MFKTVKALYCDECGDLICSDMEGRFDDYTEGIDYFEVDGKYLCSTCGDTLCESCDICDERHLARDMFCNENIHDGLYICKDCLREKIFPDVMQLFKDAHIIKDGNYGGNDSAIASIFVQVAKEALHR